MTANVERLDAAEIAKLLVDNVEQVLIALAPDGRVLGWNRGAEAVFGHSAAEAQGRPIAELLVTPEQASEVEAALRGATQAGTFAARWSCRAKSGVAVETTILLRVVTDGAGSPRLLTLTTGAARALPPVGIQANFRALLEAAPDAMVIVDQAGLIVVANDQVEAIFGYTRDEIVGQSVEVLIPERYRGVHPSYRTGYSKHPRRRPMGGGLDLCARRKDGSEFPSEISLSPIETERGPVVMAAIRDVTDRKRLEELRREALEAENRRVLEANRMKSEFLANMSHELRTPLNSIIGFAELMHDGKVGPVSADHKEFLGDILNSSRHLLQLINDVLDLAKVEAGKMEFRPEPIEMPKLVAEVRDILRPLVAKKRMQLVTEIDPELGEIALDPAKLKQVLYNYLSNAIKFTGEGGRVTVRVRPAGADAFRLEVEDTGIGIKPDELGLLFQEFRQLDASAAKKFQGTGLGLSLTKRIVEAQGGRVGVRSTYGQGSTFYAILPRVAEPSQGDEARSTTSVVRQGAPVVLVIEDEPADRAWLMGMLADIGYGVQTAGTGADAIALCRERSFDAITLDLQLPDMSGWDVLKTLRASGVNQSTPTIIVSVLPDRAIGIVYPVQDYLHKPAERAELIAALQRARVLPGEERPVLVVDDDPTVRKLVERTLREEGYRCALAEDGRRALELAAEEPPSAVVLDLLMPEVDGFEFLDRFRRTNGGRTTPVIVWTSKDLSAEERRRLASSAQAVVSKGDGGTAPLLAQLKEYLPPPRGAVELVAHGIGATQPPEADRAGGSDGR